MDKIIKLSSQQGFAAAWTDAETTPSSLNLVDFVIPRGLNIDMSRSYMSFNSQIVNTTNATPINARFTFNADGADDYNVPTAALIKNIYVRNDRGLVESVRKADTLACGLWCLTNSAETRKNDLNTFAKYVNGRGNGNYTSYQLDCVTDNVAPNGTDINVAHVSKNVERDIKIPLKDVLGIGGTEAYSTDIMGETRIHAELNMDKLSSQHLGGNELTSIMFDSTTAYGAMEGDVVADGATFGFELITSGNYGDWQYICPFFVGAQVVLNAVATPSAGGAGVPILFTTTITAMQYQTNNTKPATGADPNTNFSKVIITIADEVYDNDTSGVEQTITAVTINYDGANLALQNVINRAELCVYTIPDDGNMPTSLTYPTYTTEEDNGNGLKSFNRQYIIEPEADAVLVALCNDGNILPNRTNVNSYRYAINQDSQTGNRDIDMCNNTGLGSPLQFDRLQRCLDTQMAVGFRNAQLRFYKNSVVTQEDVYDTPVAMICETVPESRDSKMLNLNIETGDAGTDGVQKMVLYKHMYKTI
mgnify:FL=1